MWWVWSQDVVESYVKAINDKTFRTTEPMVNEYLAKSCNFKATCDFDEGIRHSDTYQPPSHIPACSRHVSHAFVAVTSSLLPHRPPEVKGTMITVSSAT